MPRTPGAQLDDSGGERKANDETKPAMERHGCSCHVRAPREAVGASAVRVRSASEPPTVDVNVTEADDGEAHEGNTQADDEEPTNAHRTRVRRA
jgi:hypothetical protein